MDNTVKLPVGIDNFKKLRTEGFYYIDKTGMITELLHNWSEAICSRDPAGSESL